MNDVRVAVLRGGPSERYGTSMETGAAMLGALSGTAYTPLDIVITQGGEWLHEGRVKYPEQILASTDVVLNALHGTYGEDGTIQRLLDRYGVRYTGSGSLASRMSINKLLTKDRLREAGVRMPPHVLVNKSSLGSIYAVSEHISDLFGPSYVIKPLSLGNSLGVRTVPNAAYLPTALTNALNEYDQVIVEKRIHGREATCGVIDRFRDSAHYVLPVVEISLPEGSDHYSSSLKQDSTCARSCPAHLSGETKSEIERMARFIHETLGLSQYSRSDFIVAHDGVYFLEVNALPELNEQALFPYALHAVGSSTPEFVRHLLTDTLERR